MREEAAKTSYSNLTPASRSLKYAAMPRSSYSVTAATTWFLFTRTLLLRAKSNTMSFTRSSIGKSSNMTLLIFCGSAPITAMAFRKFTWISNLRTPRNCMT